jgi:hypothetical protein
MTSPLTIATILGYSTSQLADPLPAALAVAVALSTTIVKPRENSSKNNVYFLIANNPARIDSITISKKINETTQNHHALILRFYFQHKRFYI